MIIFDLKNTAENISLPKGLIEIDEDISWEYMGKAEWFIIPKGVDLLHTGNQDDSSSDLQGKEKIQISKTVLIFSIANEGKKVVD